VTGALLARNFRRHGRLLGALLGGLVVLEMLIVWFGARLDAGPGLQNLVRQIVPPQFHALLASQIDLLSFAGLIGFGFQHPIVLAATAAFAIVIATIPSGELESGFLDLLLARPVPRESYFLAVLGPLVAAALLPPCAVLVGAALGLAIVTTPVQVSWTRYLPAAAELAALLLSIGGYTLLLACRARRRGTAAAWAAGITLVFFWIDALAEIWHPLELPSRLSTFHYFRPMQAAASGGVSAEHLAVLLGVFAASVSLALVAFRRRDL
jgi:ABC-type transport system involved in multi-copper enzyme maturation permease subunit